jgi:hypothetical protein
MNDLVIHVHTYVGRTLHTYEKYKCKIGLFSFMLPSALEMVLVNFDKDDIVSLKIGYSKCFAVT